MVGAVLELLGALFDFNNVQDYLPDMAIHIALVIGLAVFLVGVFPHLKVWYKRVLAKLSHKAGIIVTTSGETKILTPFSGLREVKRLLDSRSDAEGGTLCAVDLFNGLKYAGAENYLTETYKQVIRSFEHLVDLSTIENGLNIVIHDYQNDEHAPEYLLPRKATLKRKKGANYRQQPVSGLSDALPSYIILTYRIGRYYYKIAFWGLELIGNEWSSVYLTTSVDIVEDLLGKIRSYSDSNDISKTEGRIKRMG